MRSFLTLDTAVAILTILSVLLGGMAWVEDSIQTAIAPVQAQVTTVVSSNDKNTEDIANIKTEVDGIYGYYVDRGLISSGQNK